MSGNVQRTVKRMCILMLGLLEIGGYFYWVTLYNTDFVIFPKMSLFHKDLTSHMIININLFVNK